MGLEKASINKLHYCILGLSLHMERVHLSNSLSTISWKEAMCVEEQKMEKWHCFSLFSLLLSNWPTVKKVKDTQITGNLGKYCVLCYTLHSNQSMFKEQ